jgi:hypothetical protein
VQETQQKAHNVRKNPALEIFCARLVYLMITAGWSLDA